MNNVKFKSIFNTFSLVLFLVLGLMVSSAKATVGINTGLVGDDSSLGPFNIGFTFNYFGVDQTQFYASTNGLITFGGGSTTYSNTCIPNAAAPNNYISAFWDDTRTNNGTLNGKVFYLTLGEAPNRYLIVQWDEMTFYGTNTSMGTYQVVLFESSNQIKFQYKKLYTARSYGSSATIGLEGPTGGTGLQMYCNSGTNVLSEGQAMLFTPEPEAASGYHVDLFAPYNFIDLSQPNILTVSNLVPLPVVNYTTTTTLDINGTREPETSVWLNGVEVVPLGAADWTVPVTLDPGINEFVISSKNGFGVSSQSITYHVMPDLLPPIAGDFTPADASHVKSLNNIGIDFNEVDSGISVTASTFNVIKDTVSLNGYLTISPDQSQLIFNPYSSFAEGSYQLSAQLRDNSGQSSLLVASNFVLDRTPPVSPVLNVLPGETNISPLPVSGVKEAYGAIYLDGIELVSNTIDTNWAENVPLAFGNNTLTFKTYDRAGNSSVSSIHNVYFDDVAPALVSASVNSSLNGTNISVAWPSYNEVLNGGDINHYEIYISNTTFTDTSLASLYASVPAGTKEITLTGLTLNSTYYIAVVAVDNYTNRVDLVTPVSAITSDIVAPENISNAQLTAGATTLDLTWQASLNSAGDLASQRLYFNNEPAIELPAIQTTYTRTGLPVATGFTLRITSVDTTGNESTGVSLNGVTLLANPAGLAVVPQNSLVDLSWSASSPAQYVKEYAIYASTTDFSSVEGMSPGLRVSSAANTAKLAGLTNGTKYFFAITTINTSGGEDKAVTTVSSTPSQDLTGPDISSVTINSLPLVDAALVNKVSTIQVSATDPSGISRVEFEIDGLNLFTDVNGADGYSAFWDIVNTSDGAHSLLIKVYDNLENITQLSYGLTVGLAVPAAPQISLPVSGFTTGVENQILSGTAEANAQIQVYINGVIQGALVPVDAAGEFSASVTLLAGANSFTATAQNRGGVSAYSSIVILNLDSSIPEKPMGLIASAKNTGAINLSWQPSTDTRVTGYDLYRSTSAFTDISQATKVNTNLITLNRYDDVTALDNTYYYRLVALNDLNTASLASSQVTAVSDSIAPRALSIEYVAMGNFDSLTGRIAPGRVDITVTMSEELLTTPFLTITPDGGRPMSVALTKSTDTVYTGYIDVTPETVSATAYAVLSARDLVGNRGTDIDTGASVLFDTDGPAVTAMLLSPGAPIKTDSLAPTTVSVDLTIDQPIGATSSFELSYQLSNTGRVVTLIDSVVPVDELNWHASFVLPADAGELNPENLSFILNTVDDLGNAGTRFKVPNQFQVYQGDLPPLATPFRLTAKALVNGQIQLDWSEVEGALEYQLYRQSPTQFSLTAYQRLSDLQVIDSTLIDGDYKYAIASVRQENGEESISAQSDVITVVADSTPPAAPGAVTLELVGAGIKATWPASTTTGEFTYRLYRSASTSVVDVTGLTLVQDNITPNSQGVLGYVDTSPSVNESTYVATAVDLAGNESVVSVSAYLNVELLPVATLKVTVNGATLPEIQWSHTGTNINGYNIYLGADTTNQLNTTGLIIGTSFTDAGYTAGQARTYTVTAVDINATESIGRTVELPALSAALSASSSLKRNIMNQLEYQLVNGAIETKGIQLKVDVAGHSHLTSRFNLLAGEAKTVPVVVGGFTDLTGVSSLQTTVTITADTAEQVVLIQSQDILVDNSNLLLDVQTQEVKRGTAAKVRFTLENTSAVETEILTAINSGNSESSEIRFILKDMDGNILTVQPILQSLGEGVLTLSNQKSVARIAPAATFTSNWFDLSIPQSAPDQVEIILVIDKLHYKLGQTEQVEIGGLQNIQAANLINVTYSATVDSALPASSFGDQPIVITGQAISTETSLPVANVPLKIVVSANGFERVDQLTVDASGNYSYTYVPLASESGVVTVSVIHPEILARPAQGSFTIGRVLLTPNNLTLRLPYNFQESIDLMTVKVGDATTATNLRLEYAAIDQPSGALPAGITLTPAAPISLTANQSARIPFVLNAASTAHATGTLILKLYSDESGSTALRTVTINYTFSEATPALFFTPNFVETGVVHDGNVAEIITLDNRGVAPLNDVSLSLLNTDGSAAPAWVYISSVKTLDVLNVGQSHTVNIVATPDTSVPVARYQFKLRVGSTNHPVTDINVFVVVTQSGIGSVLFKAADIYTATLDENNNPIPGLQGASIRLQNEDTLVIEPTVTTDAFGEALIDNLAAGRYRIRASAPNHEDLTGRISIRPGVVLSENIFINYKLVTVEWSVTETTITDRYDITLQATFETDVPAPVVVMEPGNTNLPDMQPGDVFYGEFRFTNYGLVRAEDLTFSLPGDDAYFKYEFPTVLPTELSAKESIVLPYKIISVSSLNPDATTTGGGCGGYSAGASASFCFDCANGFRACGSAGGGVTAGGGGSCGGGGGGAISSSGGGSYGGGASSSGGSAGPTGLSGGGGMSCPPDTPCD